MLQQSRGAVSHLAPAVSGKASQELLILRRDESASAELDLSVLNMGLEEQEEAV